MKKADFIVIGVVAVIVGVMLFFLYGVNTSAGDMVQIQIDGECVETLSLDENTTREILTDNDGVNILVIENGSAVVTDANCPDGICANHRAISKTGESIICLPHKVVITIVNDKTAENEVDAVA